MREISELTLELWALVAVRLWPNRFFPDLWSGQNSPHPTPAPPPGSFSCHLVWRVLMPPTTWMTWNVLMTLATRMHKQLAADGRLALLLVSQLSWNHWS